MDAKLATTWANPERVAEVLSTDLPKDLMNKMDERGITVMAETTFWEGPYLVVQLQVQSVDVAALVESRSKNFYDEFGDLDEEAHMSHTMALRLKACLQSILSMLGVRTQLCLENDWLPLLLQYQMERILNESFATKLQRRKFHAISKVLAQDKQANYFFDTLREVREAYRPFLNFVETFSEAHEEKRMDLLQPPLSPVPPRRKRLITPPSPTTLTQKKAV